MAEFLSSTRLFQGSPSSVIEKVASHVPVYSFAAEAVIVRAGAGDTVVGILFNGKAEVRLVNAVSREYSVQEEVRVGDHFGEIPALLASAQPFEVVAKTDCVVLLLQDALFEQLIGRVAPFASALARRLAGRLVRVGISQLSARDPSFTLDESRPQPSAEPEPSPGPGPGAGDGSPLAAGQIPFVRTSDYDITEQLTNMVPAEAILHNRFLPLQLEGDELVVGMVDPHHQGATAELDRMLHGVKLSVVAIGQDDFMHTLARLRLDLSGLQGRSQSRIGPEALEYDKQDQERDPEATLNVIGDEVVGLVDKVIANGIERGASDIHIEEQRAGVRVRYRVHGMLHDWQEFIPSSFAKALVARLKVLCGLDITEHRRPQDGRVGLRVGRRDIDFRVSIMPASRGEKVVMRMFEASTMLRPLEQIFLERKTALAVREALDRPFGAIIVAGPTGSGKSSTLYACLNERRTNRPDTNICVVEDPIEYRLEGVTQVQVNYAAELNFSTVLRTFMRQDPDVIMVGEMRDSETATIALEAAMTGHLVFSSFHANNATAAIQRLENFGCNRTMIAQSMALVLVQRLVRRLCPHCTITTQPSKVLKESLVARGIVEAAANIAVPKPAGCDKCHQTGYAGRVAVLESLRFDDELRASLMADHTLGEIGDQAAESGLMVPFQRYASFLLARKVIAPGDALLAVAG